MSHTNPLAALVLSFIEALKPLFPRIATNYDIHYIRRARATERLNRIYRLAIDIFVKLQNGAFRPSRPPHAPHPQPTPTPRDPKSALDHPRKPRRIAPVRVLAARLCRELDKLAHDLGHPIPGDIRTLCNQLLDAFGLTRQAIAQRYQALRTRLQRVTETAQALTTPPTWKTLEL